MDVDDLAEQLCSSRATEQSSAWEFLRSNRTTSHQQHIYRQLVSSLIQKHADEGLRVAVLWLQSLADEQNTPDGDSGQLGLILVLSSLREIPSELFPASMTETAHVLMARWVRHVLPIMEKQFGSGLQYTAFPLMRLVDAIRLLPLSIVLPALIEIEQAKAHGYLNEVTERSYNDLLKVLAIEISPTVLLAAFGERIEVSIQMVHSALDQLRTSIDIPKIQRFFLDTTEVESVRIGAARLLGQVGTQAAVNSLIGTFQDPLTSRDVRIAAIEALSTIRASEAIPVLVDALRDTDFFIQFAAMRRLGQFGAQVPVASMIAVLRDRELPLHFVREWKSLDAPIDLEPVYRALADEQASVREFAVLLLWKWGKHAPADLLIEALQDQNQRVRWEAANALGNLGERMPQEALFAALHDENQFVCKNALKALMQSDQPLPTEILAEAVYNEHLRPQVLWLAEQRQLSLPVEALLFAFQDRQHGRFDLAARLVARRGPDAPIAQLLAILQDKDAKGHIGAAMALYLLRASVPPEPILALLSYPDFGLHVYDYLRQLLAYHGVAVSRESQLALFSQPFLDKELEQDLMTTFCSLEEQAPIEKFLGMLDDRHIRQRVVRALSELYEWVTPEKLNKVFQQAKIDKDIARRILEVPHKPAQPLYAALRLDQPAPLSDQEFAEEQIFQDLEASNERIRARALTALYQLAWQQPARVFAQTREDPRPPVRETMLFALGRLGEDAPIEVALSALQDSHLRIRAAAALTLQALDVPATRLPLPWLLHLLVDNTNLQADDVRVGPTRQQLLLSHQEGRFYSLFDVGGTRYVVLQLLTSFGAQAPADAILPLLGDNNPFICEAAAQALYTTHPNIFQSVVVPQAEACLRDEPASGVFASRMQSRIAQAVGWMGRATPAVIALLVNLLDWPYWEVRQQAIRALSTIALHHSLPDAAIQRLRKLRHDPQSPVVCQAADEALAEILTPS